MYVCVSVLHALLLAGSSSALLVLPKRGRRSASPLVFPRRRGYRSELILARRPPPRSLPPPSKAVRAGSPQTHESQQSPGPQTAPVPRQHLRERTHCHPSSALGPLGFISSLLPRRLVGSPQRSFFALFPQQCFPHTHAPTLPPRHLRRLCSGAGESTEMPQKLDLRFLLPAFAQSSISIFLFL